jgi:hypothetical protein
MDLGSTPPSKALQVDIIEINIHQRFKDITMGKKEVLTICIGLFMILAGCTEPMTDDEDDNNSEIEGESSVYRFDGVDADETTTTETNDVLLDVTYVSGKDIDWSRISVKVYVNGGAPYNCDNPNQDDSNICKIIDSSEDETEVLNVGEVFSIVENDDDMCNQDSECT